MVAQEHWYTGVRDGEQIQKKEEQNQAYPVIALYVDINWAKFQNPTHSLFWENAIWIYVVKSVNGELRFSFLDKIQMLGILKWSQNKVQ